MRTIKFRAWDKKENMMRNVISLHFLEGEDGVVVWGKSYTDHDTGERSADRNFLSMDDIELLQFTGLLDKNGKEIYEGDIVKIEDSYTPTYNAEIKWIGNGFWLTDGRGGNFLPVEKNREVVGNLYENADLLANK